MSAGEGGRRRRDNGLSAHDYASAGDVDPRVGEHLLDSLALRGIAAYLRPTADVDPVTRVNQLPARPTDRLYVDRYHLRVARQLLSRLSGQAPTATDVPADDSPDVATAGTIPDEVDAAEHGPDDPGARARTDETVAATATNPGIGDGTGARPAADGTELDFDRAWTAIVASFDDQPTGRRPARPTPGDRPEDPGNGGSGRTWIGLGDRTAGPQAPGGRPGSGKPGRGGARDTGTDEPSLLDGLDTFGAGLPDELEEDYVPPPPPPVPRPSGPAIVAVLGVVFGLVLLIHPSLLPASQQLGLLCGIVALAAGFGALVWRLRPSRDEEDPDPDKGAQV